MSKNADSNGKASGSSTRGVWQHPTVIAAVIAGVFAILGTVLTHYFTSEPRSDPGAVSGAKETPAMPDSSKGPAVPKEWDFSISPLSARIARIMQALDYRVGGTPHILTRLQAIAALEITAGENPPEMFYGKAVDILVDYVRKNIDERRKGGVDVVIDPRPPHTVRARDIVAAIGALQVIRRASGSAVKVSLGGADFHRINLSDLDMEGFYFGHANFSDGALSNCRCRSADFRHAKFNGTAVWGTKVGDQPADFRDANFLKADLAGSKWANVDFTGSNIHEAVGQSRTALMADAHGLTPEQRKLFPVYKR